MQSLKQRLRAGEQVLGTMVTTFTSPDIARLLQNCGFDFFIVDCEHGAFTTREVANIIAEARGIGMPALVRIPEMRREHALKFMEMGASGLLLPNTESAEQARMLVDCTKYAPLGHRGVSLSRPHTDFKKVNGPEYMRRANDETILMCQIDHFAGKGWRKPRPTKSARTGQSLLRNPNTYVHKEFQTNNPASPVKNPGSIQFFAPFHVRL